MSAPFPFAAIVGQEEMKQALLMAAVDPLLGGVLVFGDRGTGKSTAVRALAALLPKIELRQGCRYNCEPDKPSDICPVCTGGKPPRVSSQPAPVIDMPLGATEDRVCGSLDLERALVAWRKGLRARTAGSGQSRLSLYRRGQSARRPSGRPAARRGRLGRERGRARGPVSVRHPARFRADRLAAIPKRVNCGRNCSTVSACRSMCASPEDIPHGAGRGRTPPRGL
jgi:energy-coupling factor transporter ATP-binding protein EcfA2